MKMPWPTSSGSSPAGSASSSAFSRRTRADQLLEGLAVPQLVHVVEDRAARGRVPSRSPSRFPAPAASGC